MNDEAINQNGGQETISGQGEPQTPDPLDELKRAYEGRLREIEARLTIAEQSGYSPEVQSYIASSKIQLENLKLGLNGLIDLLKHEGKAI